MSSAKAGLSENPSAARWLLQIGLAAVFLYAAVSSLQTPADWTAYLPNFLTQHISPLTAVKILAVYELVLVVWLLSAKYLRWAGLLCALTLGGIILFNPHQLLVTFRDVGLLFASLALILLSD